MKNLYNIYSEKNLGIMHIVKRDGRWDFKNAKRGNPELAKVAILKAPKKTAKQALVGFSIPLATASFVGEHKVDLVLPH